MKTSICFKLKKVYNCLTFFNKTLKFKKHFDKTNCYIEYMVIT